MGHLPHGHRGRLHRLANTLRMAYYSNDGKLLPETCQRRQEERYPRCRNLRNLHHRNLHGFGSRHHSPVRSAEAERTGNKRTVQHLLLPHAGSVRIEFLRLVRTPFACIVGKCNRQQGSSNDRSAFHLPDGIHAFLGVILLYSTGSRTSSCTSSHKWRLGSTGNRHVWFCICISFAFHTVCIVPNMAEAGT